MFSFIKTRSILSLLFFTYITVSIVSCKKSENEIQIEYDTISDIDGNKYKVVKIGDQWWMSENLKVTKFNDGTDILEFKPISSTIDSTMIKSVDPMFLKLDSTQGILYNGYVVNSSKKIAQKLNLKKIIFFFIHGIFI